MLTIMRVERGRLVQATDRLGTYHFLADNFGKPAAGGWTQLGHAESAWESFVAEDAIYPPADVEIDERGRRVIECAYCSREHALPESLPDADDGKAWSELAVEHDDDCEWIATRAHRRD
jgi:hypothetical protein